MGTLEPIEPKLMEPHFFVIYVVKMGATLTTSNISHDDDDGLRAQTD